MRPLNPNQFALPDMEHLSDNPMAPYLEHVRVDYGNQRKERLNHIAVMRPGESEFEGRDDYHKPIGILEWGDRLTDHNYPGEIGWVENRSQYDYVRNPNRDAFGGPPGQATIPRLPGLAQAMYHTATRMADEDAFDTRPIHSETLTHDGSRFRRKVGGPGHEDVEEGNIPFGFHAFERRPDHPENVYRAAKLQERQFRALHQKMGQPTLPGDWR